MCFYRFHTLLIQNKDENAKQVISSAEISASDEEEDEISNKLPTIIKAKKDDHENVSCYCSASHTDNLSTDEHDSLRDSHDTATAIFSTIKGLQSSDSGTDLTEFIKQDLDVDWQKFWGVNGEKLIWESWITKYSAYINPNYLEFAQNHNEGTSTSDNFELAIEVIPASSSSQFLNQNLSKSDDKLNNSTEISEGWDPLLSPTSVTDCCETEVEHLLQISNRCGSYTSSSLRTVDSMTNVTHMTISSLDLSQSSDSFSSVSSVQSSLSSSSDNAEEDYYNQWNSLWKKHYEQEYLLQYQKFSIDWKELNFIIESETTDPSPVNSQIVKENIHKTVQKKVDKDEIKASIEVSSVIVNNLGILLNNLKMSNENVNNLIMEKDASDEESGEETAKDEETEQMFLMGLPSAFGNSNKRRSQKKMATKRKHCDDFEAGRNRVKVAFNLMGIEFHDNNVTMSGQVQYKMKHIRLQNRHLNLRATEQPKHVYFDDDGNVLPTDSKYESVLPDSSDNKLSSADEEIEGTVKNEQESENFVKRKRRKKKLIVPPEIKENSQLRKYWLKRYLLFEKFDEGIKLDEESWYSVTPEQIAKHTARRCKCEVIIDGFCGAGGNSIQFARTCRKVIAIDIDPKKIELAINNAKVYGVCDRIEFIVGDFFQLVDKLKADVVFLSPPWGGPSYLKEIVYDLETMLLPVSISKLLDSTRKITDNIAVFLPRNSNAFTLIDRTKPGGGVNIEQNFIKNNLVSITAYYGDLIRKKF